MFGTIKYISIMEKSIVKYLGNFRVEAMYEASKQTLKTDAGKASGGLGRHTSTVARSMHFNHNGYAR